MNQAMDFESCDKLMDERAKTGSTADLNSQKGNFLGDEGKIGLEQDKVMPGSASQANQ